MIINHNMNAMTAHRQMGINTGNQGKAIEKLSSGQRINRAGDDAAGLAISEKMRGQIRGLDGASRNAQDGISMIQTAEGALNETHNMLQRMRELAVQGSNDTNIDDDRDAIQKEMDELAKEVQRISEQTQFNGQTLLDGSFTDKKLQIGANTNQSLAIDIKDMGIENLGVGTELKKDTITVSGITTATVATDKFAVKLSDGSLITTAELGAGATVEKIKEELDKVADGKFTTAIKDGKLMISSNAREKDDDAIEVGIVNTAGTAAGTGVIAQETKTEDTQKGLSIESHDAATAAITTIDSAITSVSEQRAGMGALQNRLEHTIATNDNSGENLQAAESRIRDVDMAKEMMNLSKNNVLVQAAQSMLGQANQQPNQVLSLLR